MKTHAIVTGIAVAVLGGLSLLPGLELYARYLIAGMVVLGLYLAARTLFSTEPARPEAPVNAAERQPRSSKAETGADKLAAVTLLGVLQDKGRFLDFLMDDISAYNDAQVGAAARVVHQGCRAALHEHMKLSPVSSEPEGSEVTVPADAPPNHFRLVGKVAGESPFRGKLVHKGWKAESVNLPRVQSPECGQLPAIAPAQVELK